MNAALAQKLDLRPKAKPFLKWAGGKNQLLPEILARLPERFNRYFEPFIGGGAVLFALEPRRAFISDINETLINTYRCVKDRVGDVIEELGGFEANEEMYYAVRALDPQKLSPVEDAARFIYLNRTCFNGLYRVNRSGKFNVPFGRYKNPTICNTQRLLSVSEALEGVDIRVRDVFSLGRDVRKGDLVYLDPPYDPISPTASFTSYAKTPFAKEEQKKLARLFKALAGKGAYVILSNSDTPFINELYQDFRIDKVSARRAINSRSDRRGRVSEVLVTSW
jgi:DNA adenine methylase